MSKVRVVRELSVHAIMHKGSVSLNEEVDRFCVGFSDDKGGLVSLALDGRAERVDSPLGGIRERYGVYEDCRAEWNACD